MAEISQQKHKQRTGKQYVNFNNSMKTMMEEYTTDSSGCSRNQSQTNWNGAQEVSSCGSTPGNQS
jgi:hypothetical protein